MTYWPNVVVATPAHSGLAVPLTYRSEQPLAAGSLVRVPLGARDSDIVNMAALAAFNIGG